jgi:Arc/MetJ family transcription regulator
MCLHVYHVLMGRTNIVIDDELVERAMRLYRLPTRRAAVDFALRRLVGDAMTIEEALAARGTGWEGDLDDLRRATAPPDP